MVLSSVAEATGDVVLIDDVLRLDLNGLSVDVGFVVEVLLTSVLSVIGTAVVSVVLVSIG